MQSSRTAVFPAAVLRHPCANSRVRNPSRLREDQRLRPDCIRNLGASRRKPQSGNCSAAPSTRHEPARAGSVGVATDASANAEDAERAGGAAGSALMRQSRPEPRRPGFREWGSLSTTSHSLPVCDCRRILGEAVGVRVGRRPLLHQGRGERVPRRATGRSANMIEFGVTPVSVSFPPCRVAPRAFITRRDGRAWVRLGQSSFAAVCVAAGLLPSRQKPKRRAGQWQP